MCEREEKNEDLQEEAQVEKKDEIQEMTEKCQKLEEINTSLRASMPNISQIGRPIHLNMMNKGFLYQLIFPEQALMSLEQFADVYSVISKFAGLISVMETNASKGIVKAQADSAAKVE